MRGIFSAFSIIECFQTWKQLNYALIHSLHKKNGLRTSRAIRVQKLTKICSSMKSANRREKSADKASDLCQDDGFNKFQIFHCQINPDCCLHECSSSRKSFRVVHIVWPMKLASNYFHYLAVCILCQLKSFAAIKKFPIV